MTTEDRPMTEPRMHCELCDTQGKWMSMTEALDHLRVIHPEQYGDGPERWPDGSIVIVDQTLEPREFGAPMPDATEKGSTRDYCSRWPNEINGEGHAMQSSSPAGTTVWVRSCSFCGWIDGDDLQKQFAEAEERGRQRGRAEAIADLQDERAYALWWNEQHLPPSLWPKAHTREQFAAYLEAKGHQP